jgi:hypothetical protein
MLGHASTSQARMSEKDLAIFSSLRTRPATDARVQQKETRAARARELKSQGLSVKMIGLRMTRELGRDPEANPLSDRQVSRWLADKKKG